ncbi:MAG: FadR family transcriptional regulator [Desulfobacter sp.]|nr:MAG: FadR family transcriptional regulator [Desulfobacter sp.]
MNFTQMVPKKSYEHVVEQIQEAIFEGRIKPGERLPSEMKLKETFNTSRGTIREALRVLEHKGLVAIRTGVKGGAVIKQANSRAMRDGIELLIRHRQVSLEQLAEFRAHLEGYAARKAAEKKDKETLEILNNILEEIRIHVDSRPKDWEEFHRLDARFHKQTAIMADNPLVLANLTAVHENIHVYFHSYLPFSPQLLEEDFNDLCRIARSVAAGDGDAAEAAAQNHIAKFSRLMEGRQD